MSLPAKLTWNLHALRSRLGLDLLEGEQGEERTPVVVGIVEDDERPPDPVGRSLREVVLRLRTAEEEAGQRLVPDRLRRRLHLDQRDVVAQGGDVAHGQRRHGLLGHHEIEARAGVVAGQPDEPQDLRLHRTVGTLEAAVEQDEVLAPRLEPMVARALLEARHDVALHLIERASNRPPPAGSR
jgi:hypothetical protein